MDPAIEPKPMSRGSMHFLEFFHEQADANFKFTWSEFLKWFTFFCSFNLTAIALVHTVGAASGISPLTAAFIVMNSVAIGTGAFHWRYTCKIAKALKQTESTIRAEIVPREEQELAPAYTALPVALSFWGGLTCFLTLITFLGIWTYILLYGETGAWGTPPTLPVHH